MNRDIINRGEICETLLSTAGWKYIVEKLDEYIKIEKDDMFRISLSARKEDNLIDIRAAAERIRCYEGIKRLPLEAIEKKDRELKKPKNEEENTKW